MSSDGFDAGELIEFSQLLKRDLLLGLAYLNERVPHRFTAVNQFDGDLIRNVHVYDKQGQVMPKHIKPVAMGDSFCQFVARDGHFLSCDTAEDVRLDGHRHQGNYNAYVGVPILDNVNKLWGTLCHLDLVSQTVTDQEFDFLQRASGVLSRHLKF
ncbi:guanylate cyclase [Diaphorobacter sp. HDW4A]|uniref:GAF domain-containing protein n=1 Tax=Diaphorobacter sp. HDW4A TaxID=2714924 RepID=UPI0014079EE6|nr:GAF domain-containing protein [Diaphorobacter sp. HDW4A]QIL80750.1 guanylate cyclase [Diaphorobacter sp. HDW4A]